MTYWKVTYKWKSKCYQPMKSNCLYSFWITQQVLFPFCRNYFGVRFRTISPIVKTFCKSLQSQDFGTVEQWTPTFVGIKSFILQGLAKDSAETTIIFSWELEWEDVVARVTLNNVVHVALVSKVSFHPWGISKGFCLLLKYIFDFDKLIFSRLYVRF